jgi:hypothetical protein
MPAVEYPPSHHAEHLPLSCGEPIAAVRQLLQQRSDHRPRDNRLAVRGSPNRSSQATGMKIVGGYVTDGTGLHRVQQSIRIAHTGDHDHRRFRCCTADAAGRSYSVAGDASSHQADLWLHALGCSNCVLGVFGLGANIHLSAQRHPNPTPCPLGIRDEQHNRTHQPAPPPGSTLQIPTPR